MTTLNKHAATLGAMQRHYGADDPRTIAARRDLTAANLEDAIRRALADAPPLTDDQADRLAGMLRGAS